MWWMAELLVGETEAGPVTPTCFLLGSHWGGDCLPLPGLLLWRNILFPVPFLPEMEEVVLAGKKIESK